MSFLNSLCVDPQCRSWGRCTHLGPRGEHCYFYVEKALCDLLHKDWSPGLTLDSLLSEVRDRLAPKVDSYSREIQKAEKSLALDSIYGPEKEKDLE